MLGFTIVHSFPELLIAGTTCWFATAIWCIAIVVGGILKRRHLSRLDSVILTVSVIVLACPFFPNYLWQSATELFLGTSPRAADNLVYAAATGDRRSAGHLLKRVFANGHDSRGCAPLAVASDPDMVSLLISRGADPNGRCAADTALHRAAQKGDLSSVKLLLAAGADRSAKNASGLTPADLAWTNNHEDVSQLIDQDKPPQTHSSTWVNPIKTNR